MRVCGECAWYEYDKDEPDFGDCTAPKPMTLDSENTEPYSINFHSDATDCPCFKARVVAECLECGGTGMRQLGNEWTDEHCPACRKEDI
jgi:hypothetical protein